MYYDPLAILPRVRWMRTIYPRVLVSLDLWLCVAGHAGLAALLRFGYLEQFCCADEDIVPLVPLELALPLAGLCGLTLARLLNDCRRWHEAFTTACARVGEQTRRFAQELQATFGLVDEVLLLRFAGGKYALAAVYVFYFSLTGGSVTARGWSELRAKGLLDDREVQFMVSQYGGDRLALLHVWAMWAVQEAAINPSSQARLGPEVVAGGLSRCAEALRGASDAAREAAGRAAVPVPYHQFQLTDAVLLVSMLVLGAVAAPRAAVGDYTGSVVYLALLVGMIGLREAAASLSDPLRKDRLGQSFPVAATVNATSDAVAQLLIGSTPAAFNPCPMWWEPSSALLSQNHIERRTPEAAFGTDGANPCNWKEVKAPLPGDQAPPPLLDSGCCHLDVGSLPSEGQRDGKMMKFDKRSARQEGLGLLLARVQVMADSKTCSSGGKSGQQGANLSTGEPSEASYETGAAGDTNKSSVHDWEALAGKVASLPHEHSLASSFVSNFISFPGVIGASKAHPSIPRKTVEDGIVVTGTWADPAVQPTVQSRGTASVSPEDLILKTAPMGDLTVSPSRGVRPGAPGPQRCAMPRGPSRLR